jgi:hypothetical protein
VPEPLDVAELYERPPAEFVSARAQLVKALRAAGEPERAAGVARLRRPTPAAWALDQVARHEPELVTRLLSAGARLREATSEAMRGDASALREAEADERTAADAVLARAVAEASGADVALNDAHLQRMAATLRAAVLDDAAAAALCAGTLDNDLEAPPLGFDAGDTVVPRPPRPKQQRSAGGAPAQRAGLERLRKEADRLERRAARLQGEAEEAAQRAVELRAQAKDAAGAARTAQRQLAAAERRSFR